jgi:hypothetical protein
LSWLGKSKFTRSEEHKASFLQSLFLGEAEIKQDRVPVSTRIRGRGEREGVGRGSRDQHGWTGIK